MIRAALLIPLFMLGCKGQQQVQDTESVPVAAQPPEWVRSRPVSSAYYIGIGIGNKAKAEATETARKNALDQLAQEISVRVEGNSILFTADGRNRFDETFTSTIKTTTLEQLEGYELVDSWDSPTEHWVYYRLSKSEHARLKAQRKAAAIGTALDHHQRSIAGAASGDLRTAMDQDLRALIAMKAYWGENDLVDLNGKQVPLVNEVFGHLQGLSAGIRISVLPDRCELDYDNHFKRELLITATWGDGKNTNDLPQLPLRIGYAGLDGPVSEAKSTDGEGRLRLSVQRASVSQSGNEVLVRPDMDALVSKELEPAIVTALIGSLTVPQARAPITVRLPRVLLKAQESNLGVAVGDAGIAAIMREELTRSGFRLVEREADAEVLLVLNAATRPGGEANGFATAYLDLTYSFQDRKTKDIIFQGAKQSVKGIQLSPEKAGLDAFKKAGQEVRREMVPGIISAFQ